MSSNKPPFFHAVMGKEDTAAAIDDLRQRFERGELTCVALRVYLKDGTWEDIVLGGDEDEQAEALANLRAAKDRAN